MFWNERGHADPQVDVEPILDLLGGAFGDEVTLGLGGGFFWGKRRLGRGVGGGREGDVFDLLFAGGGYYAVDVDAWQVDGVWGDGSRGDNLFGLDYCELCILGHDGAEILRRVPEGQ